MFLMKVIFISLLGGVFMTYTMYEEDIFQIFFLQQCIIIIQHSSFLKWADVNICVGQSK